jgi:hypothetical protein
MPIVSTHQEQTKQSLLGSLVNTVLSGVTVGLSVAATATFYCTAPIWIPCGVALYLYAFVLSPDGPGGF